MMPFKMNAGGSSTQPQQQSSPIPQKQSSGQTTLSAGTLATASDELWNVMFKTYAAYQRQYQYDKYVDDAARIVECVGPVDACHFWLLKLEQANHITTRLEATGLCQIKARLRHILSTQPGLALCEYHNNDPVEDIALTTVLACYAALPATHFSLHSLERVDRLRATLLVARLCVNRDYYPAPDVHLNPGRVLTQLYPIYSATPVNPLNSYGIPASGLPGIPAYYPSPPPPRAVVQNYVSRRHARRPAVRSASPPAGWVSDDSPSEAGNNNDASDDDSLSGSNDDDDDEYTLVDGVSKKKRTDRY